MNQTIYLLRHGQTVWNAESKEKHQTHSNGRGNLLTEKGFKQADYAAELLKDAKIDYAFYTPLTRTKQTLNRILNYHPDAKSFEVPEITEMSMAFLDGMTQTEWEAKFPQTKLLYSARKENKFGCKLPEGVDYSDCFKKAIQIAEANEESGKTIPAWENYEDVIARTKSFVEGLSQYGDSILISGHQGLNRALLGNLLIGSSHLQRIESIVDLETPNAAIFRIHKSHGSTDLCHNVGNGWIPGLITKKNE